MSKALDIGVEAQHRASDILSSLANLTEYAHGLERDLARADGQNLDLCDRVFELRRALCQACLELSAHKPADAPELPADEELARHYWAMLTDEEWEG